MRQILEARSEIGKKPLDFPALLTVVALLAAAAAAKAGAASQLFHIVLTHAPIFSQAL